jgi:S1-C subfamily serine protease
MLLPDDRIRTLHAAAIAAQLLDHREVLFTGVHKAFVASIPRNAAPAAQLLLDLYRLNDTPGLLDGSVPFHSWLSQAVLLTTGTRHQAPFTEALADLPRAPAEDGAGAGAHPGSSPDPRRRPHFLDEAPFDWSRPEAQSLGALLEQNVYRLRDAEAALDRAGVSKGRIDLEAPARARWRSALEAAAQQGRARRLVEGLAADPEWSALHGRLVELLGAAPAVETGDAPIQWKALEPKGREGQERATAGKSRLVDVAFLLRGVACARSVVRVNASFGGESLLGTGFFIAPGRLLTNHHVLFHAGKPADRVELWLDFETHLDGSTPAPAIVDVAAPRIQGESERDWATLEVSDPRGLDVPPLALGAARDVRVGDHVSIIQHPHGLPKKLGIFGSEVRHVDADVVQYLTDTDAGSSGAPVFNQRWEIVALHHMWTQVERPDRTAEIRNEGIHIGRVIEALRRRGLLP